MFASLSSFLPSGLQQVAQATRPPDPLASPPIAPPAASVDPPRKKEKKEKHANEAFIIVRPPPSKSVHPLSLQVQLVPPQSRNDRPIHALDSSPDDLSSDLKRTNSHRSEASATSGYTSVGSISSFASTSTTSSGRRMIIPLYNLNVHSVMPTTILDAGTDAKVAKFGKRGLEVIGLAFLEPIEVRPSVPAHGSLSPPFTLRASIDDSFHEFGLPPSSRPVSQIRPHTSHVTINKSSPPKPLINLIVVPPPPDQPAQRSTKSLFSRVFRKKEKDSPSPSSITFTLPNDITPQVPLPRSTTLHSDDPPLAPPDTTHPSDSWPSSPTPSQTAVLGVYSTLYPPVSKPKGRPTKYIWVVRKWLKGADASILNGMMGKLNAGARDTNNTPLIEVRFEWSREQKKGSVRKSRQDKSSNRPASLTPTPRGAPAGTSLRFAPQTHNHRNSFLSHSSSGSDTGDSSPGSNAHRDAEESDDESDPEDSETPWTCVVVVQRLRQSPQQHQNGVPESVIRVKVASLAPTPHHPKVVGLLKIPFPLPDIEVERLTVRHRHVTAKGLSKTTSPKAGEFILTAEEIKDTVSSTALWLVVREAFGGVGRERKKGKS